ncbi:MAG: nodulation protein NfeD, partial [Thaumarchaeota archaeon]|nr:nodulation protein NfeD [Nitrososphaerota archaeon]
LVALILIVAGLAPSLIDQSESSNGKVIVVIEVNDYISPATAEHIESGIRSAEERGAQAVLITLNTFGGLLDSTFKITETMIQSKVPVLGFVYPSGGQALSAGTVILLASDLAAMAPATTIGSSQPVAGGIPSNDTKIVNALVEKLVASAELHGRNVTQAGRFVTHNDNLTAEKAERVGIIEVVALSPEDLVAKADGLTVKKVGGEVKLDLADAVFVNYEQEIRIAVLSVLSNPIVSAFLTAVGFLALILGLMSPGMGAEVAGAIMIILGLAGQGFNPNLIAFALMALGAALLVYELYSPGFGVFGIGGLVALAIGVSLTITQPPSPVLVPQEYVQGFISSTAAGVLMAGGFFGFLIYKAVAAKRLKRVLGELPKGEGRAVDDLGPDKLGYVVIKGEYWKAKTVENIPTGTRVVSTGSEEGVLIVKASEEGKNSS